MAITEQSRKQLYDGLEEVLGKEQATTLMEHLPPVGWADVATKQDLDHLRVATTHDVEQLRVDFVQLRVATTKDIDELRVATTNDIQQLRVETTTHIEQVRSSLSTELAHFREVTELRLARIDERLDELAKTFVTKAELYKLITAQTLTLVVAMCTITAAFS